MADPALLETLSTLSTQVDTLSEALSPLLKVPYSEWIEQQDQQPLNKAKLDVTISYALHDLIWVYLKTSGVDPTNHPVMQEIERLKGYFAKLKSAESGQATNEPGSSTDKRRMQIDKQAASRFINHAIASQKSRVDSNWSPGDDSEDAPLGVGGSGTHTRFDEGEEEEDNVLEGVEKNEEVERLLESDTLEADDQGEADEEENKKASKKGKRQILDPFAGYDQPKPSTTTEKRKLDSTEGGGASKTTTTSASSTLRNKLKTIESNPSSGTNSATSPNKKAKKKDKQKKLKLKK